MLCWDLEEAFGLLPLWLRHSQHVQLVLNNYFETRNGTPASFARVFSLMNLRFKPTKRLTRHQQLNHVGSCEKRWFLKTANRGATAIPLNPTTNRFDWHEHEAIFKLHLWMNPNRILQVKVIPPQSLICVSLKRKTVRSSLPPALVSIFFISCRMRKIFCFPEQLKVLSWTALEIGFNSLRVNFFNGSRLFFLKLRNHLGKLVVIPI